MKPIFITLFCFLLVGCEGKIVPAIAKIQGYEVVGSFKGTVVYHDNSNFEFQGVCSMTTTEDYRVVNWVELDNGKTTWAYGPKMCDVGTRVIVDIYVMREGLFSGEDFYRQTFKIIE